MGVTTKSWPSVLLLFLATISPADGAGGGEGEEDSVKKLWYKTQSTYIGRDETG
jgi:hypothetical protein